MKKPKQIMADLFTACWKDDALKGRFMADPKGVLKEHGLSVPDGIDVKVVENADDCVHITLPVPPWASIDLSDEELSNAAGGIGGCANPTMDDSPLGCAGTMLPPCALGGSGW